MNDDSTHWPLAGVGVALIIASVLGTCHARANNVDRATQLILGQALVGEGGNDNDAAIIAHLLHRRWLATRDRMGWSFSGQIRAYCAPLRGRLSPRKVRIRALTWASLPDRIRTIVERFVRGDLRDPCPSAWHFDRRASLRWTRMPRVCANVHTYNVFYGR